MKVMRMGRRRRIAELALQHASGLAASLRWGVRGSWPVGLVRAAGQGEVTGIYAHQCCAHGQRRCTRPKKGRAPSYLDLWRMQNERCAEAPKSLPKRTREIWAFTTRLRASAGVGKVGKKLQGGSWKEDSRGSVSGLLLILTSLVREQVGKNGLMGKSILCNKERSSARGRQVDHPCGSLH